MFNLNFVEVVNIGKSSGVALFYVAVYIFLSFFTVPHMIYDHSHKQQENMAQKHKENGVKVSEKKKHIQYIFFFCFV